MPYFLNPEDEDKKRQIATGGPLQSTAAAMTSAANATTAGAQGAGSGKFVNFDRVFGANQGVAQNMANTAAQNIGQTAQKAQDAVTSQETAFGNAAKAGIGGASGDGKAGGGTGATFQAVNGAYTGPTDFNSFVGNQGMDAMRAGIENANQQLGLTKDAYGLQTYLQNQNQNGNYSNGMSKWDAALLGHAGGGQFAGLRNKYAGLDSAIDGAASRSAGAVDAAKLAVDQNNAAAADWAAQMNAAEQNTEDAEADTGGYDDVDRTHKYDDELDDETTNSKKDRKDRAASGGY